MAKANHKEDASFHGVLHLMTAEDMLKLDKVESNYYKRVSVKARLYNGQEQACTVYMQG